MVTGPDDFDDSFSAEPPANTMDAANSETITPNIPFS